MSITENGNILIERVDLADCETLREIASQAGIDAWTVASYQNEIRRDDSFVLKAVDGRVIVGYLAARVVPGQTEASDAEIYNIAVIENRRKSGIGSLLLGSLLEFLRPAGVANVWLEVRQSNSTAIRFYKNQDFSEVSVRPSFYRNPIEDAILLKLELNGILVNRGLTKLDSRGDFGVK